MVLTLFDQIGNAKATLSPNDTSLQTKEVQGDNVLSLSFTLWEYVGIDVNDYVDFEGERYWAVERYLPDEKSTVEWEYNVELYGIESLIKRFLVLKNVDGENDAVFTLTGRAIDHVRLIVGNINSGMCGLRTFKVGEVVETENIVVDYFGKYCDEGLKEVAEQAGVEWWIDGETVNLCRCERGDELTLGYGRGLTSLSRDVADSPKFYTRLFPIGSSRNIDPERYGASRLQLPGGAKYVDVNVEKYGVIHHYEEEAFSGIYPRRVGHVSSVRCEHVRDSEGNPFDIWYFKDEELPFDPNDYEIGGLVKHVSFQEGSELAGLGQDVDHYFEVNFNSSTREFEIITIWPYDDETQLPGGLLVPKVGDGYILWNIRMPDEYYGLAEAEFASAVDDYNLKHGLDVSVYKGGTDHVWVEEEDAELYIGRRVRLESDEYFPGVGFRSSRITKLSRRVTLPSLMDLEISDALSRGSLSKIEDSIRDVRNYTGAVVGSLNVPDVLKSWESTTPTDNNINSARRSEKRYLRKDADDVAHGNMTFEQGVEVVGPASVGGDMGVGGDLDVAGDSVLGGDVDVGGGLDVSGRSEFRSMSVMRGLLRLMGGMRLDYDKVGSVYGVLELLSPDGTLNGRLSGNGDGLLRNLRVRGESVVEGMSVFHELIGERVAGRDENFSDGFDGWGSRLWRGSDGLWHLTVDVLTARRSMRVYEMLVEKLRSVGGTVVVSPANGKLQRVELYEDEGYYLLSMENGNDWVAGDWMSCEMWESGSGGRSLLKSYTVCVSGVQGDYVRVQVSEFERWGCFPEVGDEVVQTGNADRSERQNLIYITSSDGGARIDLLTGLRNGSLSGGTLCVRIGDLDSLASDSGSWGGHGPQGWGFYGENCFLKGEFVLKRSDGSEENVGNSLVVLRDRIESKVSDIRRRLSGVSLISNHCFEDGLRGWRWWGLEGGVVSAGGMLLGSSEELLSSVSDGLTWVALIDDGVETFVRLHGVAGSEVGIEQDVSDMGVVDLRGGSARMVELSFRYRARSGGVHLSLLLESSCGGLSGLVDSSGEGMYGMGSLTVDGEWHSCRVCGSYTGGSGLLRVSSGMEIDLTDFELRQVESIEHLSSSFVQTASGLRGLVTEVREEFSGALDDLSSEVEEEIDGLSGRVGGVESRTTTLSGQYDSLAGQYAAINTSVTGLNGRVSSLESAGFVTQQNKWDGFSVVFASALHDVSDFYNVSYDPDGHPVYTLKLATLEGVSLSLAAALRGYVSSSDYASDRRVLSDTLSTLMTRSDAVSLVSGFYERDEHGDVVYQVDGEGNYVLDGNGDRVPCFNISAQLSAYQYAEYDIVNGHRVLKGGILVKADQVDFEVDGFSLSAEKIDFSGWTRVNGIQISRDGVVSLYGVMNNGFLEITSENLLSYLKDGWLDVLRFPSTVLLNCGAGLPPELFLPCAYDGVGEWEMGMTKFSRETADGGWRACTLDDLRGLIGKKIRFYLGSETNPETGLRSRVMVVGEMGMCLSPNDGDLDPDQNGEHHFVESRSKKLVCYPPSVAYPSGRYVGVGFGQYCYLEAECKCGIWNGMECIYWEIRPGGVMLDWESLINE